jgi:hypothetical protein
LNPALSFNSIFLSDLGALDIGYFWKKLKTKRNSGSGWPTVLPIFLCDLRVLCGEILAKTKKERQVLLSFSSVCG